MLRWTLGNAEAANLVPLAAAFNSPGDFVMPGPYIKPGDDKCPQCVCSSVLRVADLAGGWPGEPTSWQGTCVHVPSAVCCEALQDDNAGCSPAFGASECLASAGAVSKTRAVIEPATIACLSCMGYSIRL